MKRSPIKRKSPLKPVGRRGKRLAAGDKSVTSMASKALRCELRFTITEVRCMGALTPHHKRKRNVTEDRHDPKNIVVCCLAHHSWIETHPAKAREMGLRIDSKSNLL